MGEFCPLTEVRENFEVESCLAPQTGFAPTPFWLTDTLVWRTLQRGLFFGLLNLV